MPLHNLQRAALVVLLCTKSPLGDQWRRDPDSVTRQDLVDTFGFSGHFADEVLRSISGQQLGLHTKLLHDVAERLQEFMWAGREPHPPLPVAKRIVESLVATDD